MNEYEKAAFLFSYLRQFKRTCKLYGKIPPREATLLYFNTIELFKAQLQQDVISKQVAEDMFRRLTNSLLRSHLFKRDKHKLWQLKVEVFQHRKTETTNEVTVE